MDQRIGMYARVGLKPLEGRLKVGAHLLPGSELAPLMVSYDIPGHRHGRDCTSRSRADGLSCGAVATPSIDPDQLLIKGSNHYQGNISALFAQHAPPYSQELCIDGILEPEPTNGHDPNAVVLRVHGYVVGYIAQQFAASVRQRIGSGVKVDCRLVRNHDPEMPTFSTSVKLND